MLTKEEVCSIVAYCNEHNTSFKDRLAELGIPTWKFYDAKRRYANEQDEQAGEFLQLVPGTFSAPPELSRKSKGGRRTEPEKGSILSVEMKTASGTLLRIQGEMGASILASIIHAAGDHVQP